MSGFNSVNQGFLGGGGNGAPGPATTVPISGLLSALADNTINNGNYQQNWQWNTLANGTGLKLSLNTTTVINGGQLVSIEMTGYINVAATTYALNVSNGLTLSTLSDTTNIGIKASASDGRTNIAGYFTASGGTNDYALIVPSNGGRVGIGTDAPTSLIDVTTNSLDTTQTNISGLALVNNTAAAVGAQQISPAIRWRGQGWKTNATAASQSVDWRAYVLPVQGSTNPSSTWVLQYSANGGAYITPLSILSNGTVSALLGFTALEITASSVMRLIGGNCNLVVNSNAGIAGNVLTSAGPGLTPTWSAAPIPSLTSTYIGYGDGSNLITGNSNFTFNGSLFYVGIDYQLGDASSQASITSDIASGTVSIGDNINNFSGGKIFFDDANSLAYYDNTAHTGKFGINTSAPTVALDVVGQINVDASSINANNTISTPKLTFLGDVANNTKIEISGRAAADEITYLSVNGHKFNPGTVTITDLAGTGSRSVLADNTGVLSAPVSDRTVKQNINDLQYGIQTLMQLKPVTFEYIDTWKKFGEGEQIGFIAQDIEKVLPGITFTTPKTGKMGYNAIDLVPVLTKALQEAILRIETLEKK